MLLNKSKLEIMVHLCMELELKKSNESIDLKIVNILSDITNTLDISMNKDP